MAENTAAPAAPMSDEDRFAEAADAVDAARKEGAKPTETPAADAAPAPGAGQPNDRQAAPGGEGAPRQRDPSTGKFLPAGATGTPREPFEGYSALPEAQRKAVDALISERQRAISRSAALQRDLEAGRRTSPHQPRPRQPAPPPPPPQPQKPRATPKWDAESAKYPEFFASLQERIEASEEAQGRQLTAIEQKYAAIDQQLQETRAIAERFQTREAEQHKADIRATLDTASPDWRRTIGWIDDDGNAVHADHQVYRPEFQAWLDGMPEKVRAIRNAELADDDPHVIASVFQRFDADFAEFLRVTGSAPNGSNATPARNPITERRAEALNDRQPRPGTGGAARRDPPAAPGQDHTSRADAEEARFLASISPENMQRWRGLRS